MSPASWDPDDQLEISLRLSDQTVPNIFAYVEVFYKSEGASFDSRLYSETTEFDARTSVA